MKKLFLSVLLLASCSPSSDDADRQGGGGRAKAPEPSAAPGPRGSTSELAALAGLYEGGEGAQRHQMCVVERRAGEQRFGLIVWGENQHSCMGSGTISREGDRVRLAMAGDSACTIEATVSGNSIRLPTAVPQGCAYYCGQRASLGGALLTQQGTSEEAAMRAKDLVGEPLCSGEGD